MKNLAATIVVAGTVALCAGNARANCAEPTSYSAEATAARVLVCPRNFDSRCCSATEVLLRQDVATGSVVALPSTCVADPESTGGNGCAQCFADTCAPAGKYRYGFRTPYACVPASCGTDYYVEVEVTSALTACANEPVAEESAPWKDSGEVCGYGGSDDSTGCSVGGGGGVTLMLNALALFAGFALVILRRRAPAGR
jgi:hypothetical protein